jgi:hypothetical protein
MKTRAPQITRAVRAAGNPATTGCPAMATTAASAGTSRRGRARRAVIAVITGEDLDLYILAAAALAITILGAVEIASVPELASSILALLAVLAMSQIRSRRQLSNIERVSQAVPVPLAILAADLPAGFVERRSEAATLFLAATSLCGPSGPAALADLRRVLRRGGGARVLLLDPCDPGALAAVSQGDAPPAGPAGLGRRIQATLDELTDLGNEARGRLGVRVASLPPAMTITGINLGTPDGVIAVQLPEHRPPGESGPVITLTPDDGFWFGYFAAEADRMWADGAQWPPSAGHVLARTPRPALLDSFGPEFHQALSRATRLLVTGVARNAFVTINYAKLEKLLRTGCEMRFLLIDPDSAAVAAAASRYYAERSEDRVVERIRQTVRLLSELRRSTSAVIALRFTSHPLAVGVIAVDGPPGQPSEFSALFAEMYPYRAPVEPKLLLQPADTHWYQHFVAESEELWATATEFPLADASAGAPRPGEEAARQGTGAVGKR